MKFTTLLILVALAQPAFAQEKLGKREILDGRVTLLVPENFKPLEEKYRLLKYPGANAPAFVLSDETTRFNLAADLKPVPITPEQLPDLEQGMRQKFSQAKIVSSGLRTLNGNQVVVVDVETPAADGTIRNIIAMTSLDGELLIISYNCLISTDAGCEVPGQKIIESITLRTDAKAN